jgi:hypothetical protein
VTAGPSEVESSADRSTLLPGTWRTVRRVFTRLAVYLGLKDDDSTSVSDERLTPLTVFIIVAATMIAGMAFKAVEALLDGSHFELADAVWHAAMFSVVVLIARVVEHQVRTRSTRRARGAHTERS